MATKPRPRICLQPKQSQLYHLVNGSRATWIGYGGSRGGAKSGGGRRVVLLYAVEHQNVRVCILRRTYDVVKENHIDKILEEFPRLREGYRVGDKEIRLDNGSVIAFRHAENWGDVKAMIGKEYVIFMVDQAEQFTERELNTMKSCARWPGKQDHECKFILTFNPGDVGHSFLQRIFYDRKYWTMDGRILTVEEAERLGAAGDEIVWKEDPEQYAFIQSYGWDNWEWGRAKLEAQGIDAEEYYSWDADKRFKFYTEETQFGREQNALPTALRIGWLLGHMNQFAGQYYDIFSRERHVAPCQPESWHTGVIGIDWGFDHDSVAHWASQINPKKWAVYREFVGGGRSPSALAQEIVDRTPESERPRIKRIFLSHDAFSQRDERDSNDRQMGKVFRSAGMPHPIKATTDVAGRAGLLYTLFAEDGIVIDPRCPKLIEVIPVVCIDTERPLNKDESRKNLRPLKFDGDDAIDSCWHTLTDRLQEAPIPDKMLAMQEFDKIADPVARWFAIRASERKQKPQTIVQPTVHMPWEVAHHGGGR